MRLIDLTGRRFERLIALEYLGRSKWKCLCDCGRTKSVDAYHLRSGAILSCGCLGLERRLAGQQLHMKPIEARFWAKVHKHPGDGCWVWTASVIRSGYGRFGLQGAGARTVGAHRFSFELANGPIPDGMCICHRCDNPKCVRPSHLFLGSFSDNTRDAINKGRRSCWVGPNNPNYGGVLSRRNSQLALEA